MTSKASFLLSVLILCSSCSPVIKTSDLTKSRSPLPSNSSVYNYLGGEKILGAIDTLGHVNVNASNSTKCNLEEELNKVHSIVRSNGGNAFLVQNINLEMNTSEIPCASFSGNMLWIDFYHQEIIASDSTLKREWKNSFHPFEGIYEGVNPQGQDITLGVQQTNDNRFQLLYLNQDAENFDQIWKEGQLKATLTSTANSNVFKADWINIDRSLNEDYVISFDNGLMNVMNKKNEYSQTFLKLYPTESDLTLASGTAFAISSKGHIVTNYHVVRNAENISIRGINGDFSRSYKAELILQDEKNDLAVLKVEPENSDHFSAIPYTLLSESKPMVGENIFVLGYPLRATMGDEIKLTNGIISSNSGFQGDITSYQISAPIQPGNSGGPLFDEQGNIVGIVSAKHIGAENVSYAIKVTYLNTLLEMLGIDLTNSESSVLPDLNRSELVQDVKDYVYIVTTTE